MENKEVKTNVANEELMQKVVGLEKELKRANSNIALALTTLTTMYAYEQAKIKTESKRRNCNKHRKRNQQIIQVCRHCNKWSSKRTAEQDA